MRRKRAALITFLLLAILVAATGIWLRAQQRQYALNRQLIAALVKGDDKQAFALVNEGADPNTRYIPTPAPRLPELVRQLFHRSTPLVNDSPTALSLACGAAWDYDRTLMDAQRKAPDEFSLVKAMLRYGGNVNAQSEYRMTPLLWAVSNNRRSTVDVLLHAGADVNVKDSEENSPLTVAIVHKRLPDIVSLLLEHRADVNARDQVGWTVLDNAVVMYSDIEIVHLLLKHGADPNLPEKNGADPPLTVAQRTDRSDLVALLRHYGARK